MNERARIVFMGTPDFAVKSLEACFELGEVVAVVCQPDKPKGRGQELGMPPVKQWALERNLPVLQPQKVRGNEEFAQNLRALKPTVSVVTAYGKILPKEVLDVPEWGSVNVHASILPRFRGSAPIQWAIASGDSETGVCLMKMDEGMDTGPIISCDVLPILATDTSASLHDKLAVLGKEMLLRDLPLYLSGKLTPRPQPPAGVVMAPMLKKDDGRLDFSKSAAELERRIRAFFPWPGTYTTMSGAMVKVKEAKVGLGKGRPGELLSKGPSGLEIACGEGSLFLLSLQPEGKRAMTAAEFLAGRKLESGDVPFGT